MASLPGIEVQSYRIGKKKSDKMLVINTFFTKELNSGPALILYITVKTFPPFKGIYILLSLVSV